MRTHKDIEVRSLAMHRLVAEKIRCDPVLLERAKSTLARWLEDAPLQERPYLEEWQRVLSRGIDAAVAVALEESEHAATLRQCSPFAGILSGRERFAFLREWKRSHAA